MHVDIAELSKTVGSLLHESSNLMQEPTYATNREMRSSFSSRTSSSKGILKKPKKAMRKTVLSKKQSKSSRVIKAKK